MMDIGHIRLADYPNPFSFRSQATKTFHAIYCQPTHDTVICWPLTHASSLAYAPCPKIVRNIILLPGNVTRYCNENGTWHEKSDYTQCIPRPDDVRVTKQQDDRVSEVINIVYYVGYSISVVALLFAISLFLYFRGLRCLRNAIHCHLMVTFILKNILWLKSISIFPAVASDTSVNMINMVFCRTVTTLINYFLVTNFFWMLVEGLYLHTIIVWAFSVDKLKLWHFVLLGWGVPVIFVVVWIPLKLSKHSEQDKCWLSDGGTGHDYLFIVPIFVVLLLNVVFLASIVWVLITKLRATNSTQNCLYRKAAKATLILFPLLGLTYILFIWFPVNEKYPAVAYSNALLQSTQGLFVAVFYCFLNAEVRMTIRTRMNRWSDGRSIRNTRMSLATHIEQVSLAPTVSPCSKGDHPPSRKLSQSDMSPSSGSIGGRLQSNGSLRDESQCKTVLFYEKDDTESQD